MADALGFAPDVEIRAKRFGIGCIGAGFIMADVHLAAYARPGFPVVAIASRTHGQGRGGRGALGHPARPRDARVADRGPRRSRSSTSPSRPTSSPT